MAMLQGLLRKLNGDEEDPLLPGAQAGMAAPPMAPGSPFLPGAPAGGGGQGNILASRSGPIDPAEQAGYESKMADITRRTQGLNPLTGGPALAGLGREQQDAQRKFFGDGYLGGAGQQSPSPFMDSQAPTGAAPVRDYGRLSAGYDAGKLNDPNKHDFKYDTARVMSQFDPRQGFTPDVINALNQLDYGTFSGAGDKLSLSGAKNAKDAGDFANQDWITALKAQNGDTKWNFGGGAVGEQEARQAPQMGGMGRPSFAGSTIPGLLQGDAQGNIQSALGHLGNTSDDSMLQRLIAQLRGGQ